MTPELATYSGQVNAAGVRTEMFDGRVHVVAPVVAVRESVLKGYYLPNTEIESSAPAFNGVPLPVGHPMEGGNFVSANTPKRIESQSAGRFFNVDSPDGGQSITGEIYVDAEKSARLAQDDPVMGGPLARLSVHLDDPGNAGEFIDALPDESHAVTPEGNAEGDDDGGMLEVSTAYWFDAEDSPGTFDGNTYAAVQRNVRPDHLALLPHQRGECSVADGCGAPRANSARDGANDHGDGGGGESNESMTPSPAVGTANPISLAANAIGRFAHNCMCGCGGSCHTTMDPEELHSLTGISLEVLEAMDESDRKSLAALADEDGDAGADGGHDDGGDGGQDDKNTAGGDGDGDAFAEVVGELREELSATRDELAEVRESVTAQEREEKEALVDAIEGQSSLSREDLEDLDKSVLEGMHADLTPPRADFGGRVSGIPAGNTQSDDADERVSEARELAAQLSGTPATDGGTTGDE